MKLLCFSLKMAEVSLSKSGYLVSRWLTPHRYEPYVLYDWARIWSGKMGENIARIEHLLPDKRIWVERVETSHPFFDISPNHQLSLIEFQSFLIQK